MSQHSFNGPNYWEVRLIDRTNKNMIAFSLFNPRFRPLPVVKQNIFLQWLGDGTPVLQAARRDAFAKVFVTSQVIANEKLIRIRRPKADFRLSLHSPLQWRHNERHGNSNHRRRHCLLNFWFRRIWKKKHQGSASLGFVRGIHRWPVSSPYKRPVTRKMFPFDDIIMCEVDWNFLQCELSKRQFLGFSVHCLIVT